MRADRIRQTGNRNIKGIGVKSAYNIQTKKLSSYGIADNYLFERFWHNYCMILIKYDETVLEPGRPLSSERAFNSDRIRIKIISHKSQGYEHEKR